jgi:hypothetical protein
MRFFKLRTFYLTVVAVITLHSIDLGTLEGRSNTSLTATSQASGPAVLWREPVDITSRDLYYGAGGKANEPSGTFTFKKEEMEGSSPKFDIIDQDGVAWRVKMGDEARPETAASRLVWAAGYFVNDEYFVSVLHVRNMPHLHRGANLVSADGTVHNVRLKKHRKDQKKLGTWSWSQNPFTGTREWFGLRVLMAVINNWDLKDSNNSVYQFSDDQPEIRYVVSDLGASFGSPGLNWAAKGNVKSYTHTQFIGKTSPHFVDFNIPAAPKVFTFINVPELALRMRIRWIGQHVPVEDARWMGKLLGQLSSDQIRDAFRAAGYPAQQIETYRAEVERRIAELQRL